MSHKITLKAVSDQNNHQKVTCHPNQRKDNSITVGDTLRFEAADQSNAIDVDLSGSATFNPGQSGSFFQEFVAKTAGAFDFGAKLTLPDKTVISWEPDGGGQGEVQ